MNPPLFLFGLLADCCSYFLFLMERMLLDSCNSSLHHQHDVMSAFSQVISLVQILRRSKLNWWRPHLCISSLCIYDFSLSNNKTNSLTPHMCVYSFGNSVGIQCRQTAHFTSISYFVRGKTFAFEKCVLRKKNATKTAFLIQFDTMLFKYCISWTGHFA